MPKLDAKNAEETAKAESGWDMEPGFYEVELSAVLDIDPKTKEPFRGKESGEPYWKWEVTFPDDANEGRYKRRKLWRQISLGDKTAGMRRQAFAAFGEKPDVDTDTMIGRRCIVEVYNEKYNGQDNAKIKNFLPLETTADPYAGDETGGGKGAKENGASLY